MFLVAAAVVLVLVVPLLGGDLRRLRTLTLTRRPVLFGALVVQVLITTVPGLAPRLVLSVVHVLTYLALGYVVWANRRLPGVAIFGLGTGLNAIAITANGGRMPASAAALRAAGLPQQTSAFANSAGVAHPHLGWLGDVMSTPSFLPLRNMLSVGDLLILVGAAVLVHRTCAYRGTHRAPRRGARKVTVQRITAAAGTS